MRFKDYYALLGITPDASEADIKKAFRRLAKKFHPDVSQETDAEARFKDINEAHDTLSDPQKRAAYDQLRASGLRPGDEIPAGGGFGGFEQGFGGQADFSDILESLFRGQGGPRGPRRGSTRSGGDVRARLDVDLETAYSGGRQRFSFDSGQGPRTLEVKIPAGILPGQTIRLSGQGHPGRGGSAGDLLLEVQLRPHPRYELKERDVHVEVPIQPWQAAMGARITVPTLKGDVELQIPAGSGSGRKLRLKGRGWPTEPAGDQYVHLVLHTPAIRDDADRRFYEEMARHFQAEKS